MSISLQTVAASLTQKAVLDLIDAARATPDDKANWQPLGDSRPILEQLVECCLANRMWAGILTARVHTLLPDGEAARAYAEIDTLSKVIAALQESGEGLADVIKNIPDADLAVIIPFPGKGGEGRPVAECCLHAFWNMTYHLGQVSYIQTLYGDWDEHGDIGPFGERLA